MFQCVISDCCRLSLSEAPTDFAFQFRKNDKFILMFTVLEYKHNPQAVLQQSVCLAAVCLNMLAPCRTGDVVRVRPACRPMTAGRDSSLPADPARDKHLVG